MLPLSVNSNAAANSRADSGGLTQGSNASGGGGGWAEALQNIALTNPLLLGVVVVAVVVGVVLVFKLVKR